MKLNVLNAQKTQTITIGNADGEADGASYYIPSRNYGAYSLTQQIFTAAEMQNKTGNITKISFKAKLYPQNRKFQIYLQHTDKSIFASSTDWVNMTGEKLYEGELSFNTDEWTTITLDKPFYYEGGNLILCVNDISEYYYTSGQMQYYSYITEGRRSLSVNNDSNAYNPSNAVGLGGDDFYNDNGFSWNGVRCNSYVQFTIEATTQEPSIEVSETSIALGDVRMGDYWSEKTTSSQDVEVEVSSTKVTSVTCNNNFFTISNVPTSDDLGKNFTFNVGYNKEANVTGTQEGAITIKADDVDDITIPVTATAYTATAPDAIEVFTTVTFDANNSFTDTPTFANLHDDYILPGEETDGNAPDAVYKFTLDKDVVVSAEVTGTNLADSYLAIYKEDDLANNNGPSSNNNYEGVQAGPEGPTTFSFDFNDQDISKFNLIDEDGDGNNWAIKTPHQNVNLAMTSYSSSNETGSWVAYSPINIFYTKDKYHITSLSKFSYDVLTTNYGETYAVVVSEDGENFTEIFKETYNSGYSYTVKHVDLDLKDYNGKSLYIGFKHYESTDNYFIAIDNLALTDGSSKSRGVAPAIDGVQYPSGTYYLVAAADKAFTVNLSTEPIPAPEAFALTAPENEATEQDNPKLTWEAAEYATSYNVYIGTNESLENVEAIEVENNFYQTENLSNNTRYYWTVKAVNDGGTTETETWSFVTTLDVPENVITENEEIVTIGDEITISWNTVEKAASYNVYVGDKKVNTEAIVGNEYTFAINAYNSTEGVNITVTAVYTDLGESKKSEPVNIKVKGKGTIKGIVTDGSNPVSGAVVVIAGTEEFGESMTYNTTTDFEGKFEVETLVGSYKVSVSRLDYQDAEMNGVEVEHVMDNEIEMVMQPNPEVSIDVTSVDLYYESKTTWTTDEYETFNVYRRNVETGDVEKIASDITAKQLNDADWAELEIGDKYEYGVTTYAPGGIAQFINEGFEHSGVMPEGWTRYSSYAYVQGWYFNNSYANNGTYSAYVRSSTAGYIFKLTTPEIDLNECNSASLSFYYKNYPYIYWGQNYGDNNFKVKVTNLDDNKSEYIQMDNNVSEYQYKEIDLSNYVGKRIQIDFECTTAQWAETYIDDVVVSAVPMVESKVNWSPAITKEAWSVFNGSHGTEWNNSLNWKGTYPQTATVNVVIDAAAVLNTDLAIVKNMMINSEASLTLPEGVKLMVGGRLMNTVAANLLIEDGAQIYHTSEGVKAKLNMNLNRPEVWSANNREGWNFVASPFTDVNIPQFTGFGFDEYDYDLYKYDGSQEAEWLNHKDAANNGAFESANFDLGIGYLLSHEQKETVSFAGTLSNAQYYSWDNLSYTTGSIKDHANFHLLGNPFTFDMDLRGFYFENMVEGCAVLNAAGNAYVYKTTGTIPVGDAFFVKTTDYDPSVSYGNANSKRGRDEEVESINLIATGKEGSDNVIISLSGAEKEGFNKLQNFNEGIANIFVAKNDTRYGIANFDREVTMVDVAFEATQMGNYTIAAQPNGKFKTLTLVDRFTGIETNLLVEDYNFTATSNDDYNRFIVKLKVNGQEPTDNSHFAYVSGEDLILNIEGSVQIIDMMGRVVYTSEVESANNRINVSGFNNAAYIIRVINEEGVKVQKIIL